MNNKSVEQSLVDCNDELVRLEDAMSLFGATSPIGIYLSRYAIIKACGAIEQAFKSLVADSAESKQSQTFKLVYCFFMPDNWFEVQGGVGKKVTSGWTGR